MIFVKEAVLSILIFLKRQINLCHQNQFQLDSSFLSVMTCFIYVYVISFRVDQTASFSDGQVRADLKLCVWASSYLCPRR